MLSLVPRSGVPATPHDSRSESGAVTTSFAVLATATSNWLRKASVHVCSLVVLAPWCEATLPNAAWVAPQA